MVEALGRRPRSLLASVCNLRRNPNLLPHPPAARHPSEASSFDRLLLSLCLKVTSPSTLR